MHQLEAGHPNRLIEEPHPRMLTRNRSTTNLRRRPLPKRRSEMLVGWLTMRPRPSALLSSDDSRRLTPRYERRADMLRAFLHLACGLICAQKFSPLSPSLWRWLQRWAGGDVLAGQVPGVVSGGEVEEVEVFWWQVPVLVVGADVEDGRAIWGERGWVARGRFGPLSGRACSPLPSGRRT